jgi:long-chain fatty acid transport protein
MQHSVYRASRCMNFVCLPRFALLETVIGKKAVLAAALMVASSATWAVGNFEPNAGIQFNFSNPGARSLGMGGAYLGFSDDATAAYTNPAGLTVLGTKELFVEVRASRFDTPFVNADAAGAPFQDRSESSASGASYAAFVYPGEGWSIGVYRNVELDFENEFSKARPISVPGLTIFRADSRIKAKIVNYGLSGGYQVNDQLSLGASVVHSLLDVDSFTLRETGVGTFNTQFERGDDEAWTATLGLLYRFDDRLSLGAAYRRGADFDLDVFTGAGTFRSATDITFNSFNPRRGEGAFDVPHQFGVGVAYRVTEQFALGFDAHYIDYNRLSNDPLAATFDNRNEFDSGTELRLGGEYVFATENPVTVRAGVWRNPDHAFTFRGTPANNDQLADQVLFPRGDDELHVSVGFGFAFEQGQVDFGADFSDLVDTYSLSAGLRF